MKKKFTEEVEKGRQETMFKTYRGDRCGVFEFEYKGEKLTVIMDDDTANIGWEHVSISLPDRCPTWQEMDYIKKLFWEDDETVIQIHPREIEKVNICQSCLHLWKSKNQTIILPPSEII